MKNATKARQLVASQQMGVLSTHSRRHSGFPFGSVVAYGLDSEGRPIFLMSGLAVHLKNLQAESKASLTIFEDEAQTDPMSAARVTLMGEVQPVVAGEDLAAVRAAYLSTHPTAGQWADFGDFAFLRMEVKDLYFIAGFGSMGWILPEDYRSAEV